MPLGTSLFSVTGSICCFVWSSYPALLVIVLSLGRLFISLQNFPDAWVIHIVILFFGRLSASIFYFFGVLDLSHLFFPVTGAINRAWIVLEYFWWLETVVCSVQSYWRRPYLTLSISLLGCKIQPMPWSCDTNTLSCVSRLVCFFRLHPCIRHYLYLFR